MRVLETPQARVDILPCALERGREHRRIARGFRCSTGVMGPEYERSVPKKADPAEDGARLRRSSAQTDQALLPRVRRASGESRAGGDRQAPSTSFVWYHLAAAKRDAGGRRVRSAAGRVRPDPLRHTKPS